MQAGPTSRGANATRAWPRRTRRGGRSGGPATATAPARWMSSAALPARGEELGPLLVERVQKLDGVDVGQVLGGRAAALELD
jgi:hypothetical protein